DWTEVIGTSPVRHAIPLRVIDELDEKKFARRGELADRARTVLAHLERLVGALGAAAPVPVPLDLLPRRVLDLDRWPAPHPSAGLATRPQTTTSDLAQEGHVAARIAERNHLVVQREARMLGRWLIWNASAVA